MRKSALLFSVVAVMVAVPSTVWAQGGTYPIIVVPTAEGPFTFPQGYQTPWDEVEMMVTEKMSPNLFVVHGSRGMDSGHPDGAGGRLMVLFGPDGVLMVDGNHWEVEEKTLAAIRSFTDAPIKAMVNSHVHNDHTGANAFWAKQGALIFAQENLRLVTLTQPTRNPAGIPVVTYRYDPAAPGVPAVTLNMNGETVDFIPVMPSHTSGDTAVRFRNANVIYVGDIYRNFGYPFAAQNLGGTIKGMIEAMDFFQTIAGPDTWLVPGHGKLVHREDLLVYRDMIVDIFAKVTALRNEGKSLEEVLALNLTAPYDEATQGDTQSSKNRFVTAAYNEVSGLPPIVNGGRVMQ